jgi:hypothetical protein
MTAESNFAVDRDDEGNYLIINHRVRPIRWFVFAKRFITDVADENGDSITGTTLIEAASAAIHVLRRASF